MTNVSFRDAISINTNKNTTAQAQQHDCIYMQRVQKESFKIVFVS